MKCSHFLAIHISYYLQRLAEIYVAEIVWLYGMPVSITLDLDPRFKSWERYLLLVEFIYNNSYQASIQIAHFEALYGRRFPTPLCWVQLYEKKIIGPELVCETEDRVKLICEKLKAASDRK
ncbi:Retrotransposable element Tf2 [Gossypium australe]|uniref:Retrotransposable element Tf2 n=1 Tax=Gossypium australe TaxID=47621 RepID=A0A5B6W720_9ROSI|nr:Retrotransposable element Tf2 [Gossypium australe]